MASDAKKKLVQQLSAEIKEYPIVGVVNLERLPAQQYQVMRSMLAKRGVKIRMARKRLLQRALDESNKKNIQQLRERIKGMPAIILSKDNPFSLYATIQKNKSEAPAKGGQVAPRDIIVKAGPTSFAPGPIISELAAVGIKTKVEAGKLAIMNDTTVAKEGQVISAKLAEVLKRLDIKPMEIGLDLVAVWEDGFIFDSRHLHIDEAEFARNLTQAAQWAMNLAVEMAYACKDTADVLLQKAFREAKAVAMDAAYITEETKDELLARSEREALSVKEEANL